MYIVHCAKNNQNLRIKTEPVTTGATYIRYYPAQNSKHTRTYNTENTDCTELRTVLYCFVCTVFYVLFTVQPRNENNCWYID